MTVAKHDPAVARDGFDVAGRPDRERHPARNAPPASPQLCTHAHESAARFLSTPLLSHPTHASTPGRAGARHRRSISGADRQRRPCMRAHSGSRRHRTAAGRLIAEQTACLAPLRAEGRNRTRVRPARGLVASPNCQALAGAMIGEVVTFVSEPSHGYRPASPDHLASMGRSSSKAIPIPRGKERLNTTTDRIIEAPSKWPFEGPLSRPTQADRCRIHYMMGFNC